MGLTIPAAMEDVLKEADESTTPLDEGALCSKLIEAAGDPRASTPEERVGAFSEIAAWRFMHRHSAESEPWGIYWGPLASGTLADGKTFYSPDVAEIDEQILAHWIRRAASAKHPAMRARYADLAWEIGRYLKRPVKDRHTLPEPPITLDIPVSLAHSAIDGYLDAVERGLAEDEYHSWIFLDRAIGLSISLNDKVRTGLAKAVLFGYYRKIASGSGKFMWWRLSDLTAERGKVLALDEVAEREIVESLEAALNRHSDINDKERFDPHAAMNAADHLIRRLGKSPDEVHRVIRRAAGAFEEMAKDASAMLAIAWLEGLIPRYRNAGLVDDAARVERAIRSRAQQARGEMKQVAIPVEIPREEIDKWVEGVVGTTLPEGLVGIALNCMSREEITQKSVQEILKNAPLLSIMSVTIMGADGFTKATINSLEDDLEGRAIQHAADQFNWHAPLLHLAFARLKEKYAFELDALVTHINAAPSFAPSREGLLREGLAAWFSEDPVKAIHVLVPQVEAACRDLLSILGAPVVKHDANTGGFEVIGMGAILNHPAFRKGVPRDIRFHLRALYSDPRGLNLRNHLAHGISHVELLGMGLGNWVVHSILLLATLRIRQRPSDDSVAPQV